MRHPLLMALGLALAGCGAQQQPGDNAAANVAELAAPSPDALAAKAQVERYFQLIAARNFEEAYKLWEPEGASRSSPAALAGEYAHYKQYDVTVGDPTEIKAAGNFAYIIVGARAETQRVSGGSVRTLDGRVHLKRAIPQGEAKPGPWLIWAVDIRKPGKSAP